MTFQEFAAKLRPTLVRTGEQVWIRLKALLLGPETTEPFAVGRLLRLSAAVLITFMVLFGLWATIVPLDSAVMAQGVVAVESKRKKVQHLEGGILERIERRQRTELRTGVARPSHRTGGYCGDGGAGAPLPAAPGLACKRNRDP
jgi:hypothetical protein